MTIIQAISEHARQRPDATAFIAENQRLCYSELWELARGFARQLRSLGIRKGDRIVMQTEQTLSFIVAYFGTHLAGGIFVPVDKTVSVGVLLSLAERAEARMLIARADAEWPLRLDTGDVLELARQGANLDGDFAFPEMEDSAEMLFTTGTTGASKGVLCSHSSVVGVAQNLIHGMKYHQNTLIAVPGQLNHANGIRKLTAAALMGSGVLILDGLTDLNAFFYAIENWPVNALCLPPAAVRMILVLSGDKLGRYCDQIEFVESAASNLPETDKQKLIELLPHARLYNAYGTSEAGSSCMYDYAAERGLVSCIGYPAVNARFVILDEQGHQMSDSSRENPGLIAYTGSMMMAGYWKEPELTAATLRDGFVHTSDLGYMDGCGRVFILGRRDDVINVGGKKVAPDEVEQAALTVPGIAECGCGRMRDPIAGEAARLFVVMREGAAFDANIIRQALRAQLEEHKIPRSIERRDSLPHTPNGKLLRRELK